MRKKHKYREQANREQAKEQGFYDGRFRPKVVKDLKKHRSKRAARDWKRNSKET